MQYGHLIDIGRKIVDERVPRSWAERTKRKLLRQAMLSPLFGPAMRLGQAVRGALPQALRRKVPERRDPGRLPQVAGHARQVLMLAGCVQPSMMPTIDAATIRVLDALASARASRRGGLLRRGQLPPG